MVQKRDTASVHSSGKWFINADSSINKLDFIYLFSLFIGTGVDPHPT